MIVLLTGTFDSMVLGAGEFGLILDVKGKPVIKRGNSIIHAEFGQEVAIGDSLRTKLQDLIVIVAYKTCEEWTLSGSQLVKILDESNISCASGSISPARKLPVCYQPELFDPKCPTVMGGIQLRGVGRNQPENGPGMDKLKQTADSGKASNSELMSLIIFSLSQGDEHQAKKYFSQLSAQNPGAAIPKALTEKLNPEKKTKN